MDKVKMKKGQDRLYNQCQEAFPMINIAYEHKYTNNVSYSTGELLRTL